MKTTKNYIVVFLFTLLWHLSSMAQYTGGDASGAATENLSNTICGIPAHFNAYFGGDNDTATVDELSNTACGIPPGFFAYMGGENDGATVDELSATVCGIPPSFYAYMGGENDTAATDELMVNICPFPPSFYAYFGGDDDGFVVDRTAPVCPTQPPVASFTASATEICVGQSVTFTDTSTNIPSGWNWTFAGGTSSTSTAQNPVITYNTAGTYTVTLTSANYNGTNTVTQTGFITVYAFPTVSTVVSANRCGAGTLTLSATASAGTLSWYADPTGGTALGTGTSFTTPNITATTSYYVETVIGTCTSARRLVTATINEIPTITSTTPGSRCGTGFVQLSAVATIGTFEWFANATGGSPIAFGSNYTTPNNLSATRDYYVEAVNGTCRSGRVAVTATINPAATITSTTPGFACDSGQVTLGATTVSGTLNWYNAPTGGTILGTGASFTTPNLTVPATYYVEVVNGTCTSARTAVVASVFPTPLVTSTTQVKPICVSGSTTLTATSNYNGTNTWAWYDTPTGGTLLSTSISYVTPVISTNTTYYVATDRFGCTSPRTAITATITPTPTITATTPESRCGTGSVALSATASAGAISWWTAATGGTNVGSGATFNTPSIATTTTYYVQTTNNTCVSTRSAVVATITGAPTITATTPANRCGSGSVTLGAIASAGTLNWYAASTGGTSLGTGASFITPTISATTTYYVGANDGTCASARTAVTATILPIPTLVQNGGFNPVCGSGTPTGIIFSTTPSSPTSGVRVFDASIGGNLLSTSTSTGTNYAFTLPFIGITTTFYFESFNSDCTSSRLPITVEVRSIPTVTVTSNSGCAGTAINLSAIPNNGTVAWYTDAVGGTQITVSNVYQPILNVTTTYYVQASFNGCTSARVPVTATVIPTPTITATTPASNCGTGSVTLGATASAGTLNWYAGSTGGTSLGSGTSFTTPSISATTTYYVGANDGACTSARTAVIATINTIPGITIIGNNNGCDAGTVTLSAVASAGNVVWYANATGGTALATANSFTTPSLSTTTTYYAEAVNGSCVSATRTAVVATINNSPTITATSPSSRCGAGSLTLSAIPSSGSIVWYATATGGTAFATANSFTTASIVATTTYYAEALNGICNSARIAVVATIDALPTITASNPASQCGSGSFNLSATSSGSLSWFAAANGGIALANGSSFVTPTINATTVYYVESTNGTCTTTRTAVTAIITNEAAPTGVSNQTFCVNETVGNLLINGANINWYANANGGAVLPNSTPLVAGNTYYASQTISGCESNTRLGVAVSLGGCLLANESFTKIEGLKIYPNPVIDVLNVSCIDTISKIEITNILGQTIGEFNVNAFDHQLYMSRLSTGTYLIKVSTNDQSETFKVMKK